jgi:hypothetical protein
VIVIPEGNGPHPETEIGTEIVIGTGTVIGIGTVIGTETAIGTGIETGTGGIERNGEVVQGLLVGGEGDPGPGTGHVPEIGDGTTGEGRGQGTSTPILEGRGVSPISRTPTMLTVAFSHRR